jgi:hypothetical protein
MVSTTLTNKPINPRGNDQSPKGYNRAALYSGKALDFDGVNDEVNCGDIDIAFNEISFAFHFNADSFSNNCIFQKESVFRFIGVNTNQIDIVLATTGNSWYSKKITLTNLESKDYFLVATYNGSELKAYLNGVLVDTLGDYSGSVVSVSQNVYVGRTNGGLYYNGKISGTKIFNTALTAAQVADLYNNPEKVVPTGVDNTALKLWLPMQEGAGTTAYDGSGNGNHGTISGATYVHGIGAPVSQTAVIDWNKGTNLLGFSEQLQRTGVYTQDTISVTSNTDVAPNGLTQAATLTDSSTSAYAKIQANPTTTSGTIYYAGIYVKKATSAVSHYCGFQFDVDNEYIIFDNYNGTYVSTAGGGGSYDSVEIEDVNSDWWRILVKVTANGINERFAIWPAISNNGTSISTNATGSNVFWGASVSTSKPYLTTPTNGTQTSPVLLPQGLTSGRDITGVNLFENVRKQGALNLDGNSWAEVHDNASLDITDAITLEAWVYWENTRDQTGIMGRWGANSAIDRSYMLYIENSTSVRLYINTAFAEYTSMTTGWRHIVGTYDKTNMRLYVDGTQVAVAAQTEAITTSDKVLEIGRYRYATDVDKEYTNDIAQPRIYNRALTAEEVQRNYNAGKNIYTN